MMVSAALLMLVSTPSVETSSSAEPKWSLGAGITLGDYAVTGTFERRITDGLWLRMGLNVNLMQTTPEGDSDTKSLGALLGLRFPAALDRGLTFSPVADLEVLAKELKTNTSGLVGLSGWSDPEPRRHRAWSLAATFGMALEKPLLEGLALRAHVRMLTLGFETGTISLPLISGLSQLNQSSSQGDDKPVTTWRAALGLSISISLWWIF